MEGPVLLYVLLVHFRQWIQNDFSCHSRHTCSIIKVLIYSGLVRNVKMTATKTKTYIARKVNLLKGFVVT